MRNRRGRGSLENRDASNSVPRSGKAGALATVAAIVAVSAFGATTTSCSSSGADECTTQRAFFEQNVWSAFMGSKCAKCHSPGTDLAGVGTRYQGLALFQRMLNPTGRGRGSTAPRLPEVTVTIAGGRTVTGRLVYQDEFTIALTDSGGIYRSWPTSAVSYRVDDPYEAHFSQLGRYTNDDLHNVLAYLQTLR